jgi:glycosyltransferase involved in cell wall biosynthesis
MIRNNNGLLVPPKNAKALADAIKNIIDGDCAQMGKNSRKLAEESFCQKIIATKTIGLYS